jgi:hypothetical protein
MRSENRHDEPRLSAYMPAKIIVPGKVSEAPCVVRQMSPAGAQLQISPNWILPRNFWLRIIGDYRLYQCTHKWRRDLIVGVEFQPTQSTPFQTRVSRSQLPNRARMSCPPTASVATSPWESNDDSELTGNGP